MRWSYKTVHFELKKEGLLGSAFLDESEIEETLNEYGRGGWELVSMLETRDGVIVVFKQPLDLSFTKSVTRQEVKPEEARALTRTQPFLEELEAESIDEVEDEEEMFEEESEVEDELPDEPDNADTGVGSIRIE